MQTDPFHNVLGQLFADSTIVLLVRIGSAALSYLGVLLLARWLTPSDYGHYATIISFITLTSVVCRLGMDLSVIKFIGQYIAAERPDLIWGLVQTAERVALISTLFCAVLTTIGFLAAEAMGAIDSPLVYIAAVFLILPAFMITDLQSSVIRSFKNIFAALAPKELLWRAAIILTGLLVLWLLPIEERLLPLVIACGLSLTGLAIWQRSVEYHLLQRDLAKVAPTHDLIAWWRTTAPMWLTQVMRVSFRSVDVLIVGMLLAAATAGHYFAASRTAELMGFLLASINLLVGPTTAHLFAAGQHGKLQRYLSLSAIIVFVPSLSIFLLCIFEGDLIMGLFGRDFLAATPTLAILAFGQMVNASMGSVGVLLNMTGHERINALVLTITAPLTVIAELICGWRFGLEGVALASTLGIVIWNIWLWIEVRRRTPFDPSIFGAWRLISWRARP
jgi:O-antigen/teichoic acid export membrane protein